METCGDRCTSLLVHGFNFPLIRKLFPIGMAIEDGSLEEGSGAAVWPDYRRGVHVCGGGAIISGCNGEQYQV